VWEVVTEIRNVVKMAAVAAMELSIVIASRDEQVMTFMLFRFASPKIAQVFLRKFDAEVNSDSWVETVGENSVLVFGDFPTGRMLMELGKLLREIFQDWELVKFDEAHTYAEFAESMRATNIDFIEIFSSDGIQVVASVSDLNDLVRI